MAGFSQASHTLWTSRVGQDDDPHVDAASHAQPGAREPELLELYGPEPNLAGDLYVCVCAGVCVSVFLFAKVIFTRQLPRGAFNSV